jgi:hypothetical protein
MSTPYQFTGGLGASHIDPSNLTSGLYLLLTPGRENPDAPRSDFHSLNWFPMVEMPELYDVIQFQGRNATNMDFVNRLSFGLFLHLTRQWMALTRGTHAFAKIVAERQEEDGNRLALLVGPFFAPLHPTDPKYNPISLLSQSTFAEFYEQFSSHLWGFRTPNCHNPDQLTTFPNTQVNLRPTTLYSIFDDTQLSKTSYRKLVYEILDAQRYNPFYQDMMRKEAALEFAEIGYDSDNEEGRQYLSDLKNNKIEYFRDDRDYEKSANHLEKVYRKMKRPDEEASLHLDLLTMADRRQPKIKNFFAVRPSKSNKV